MSQNVSQISQVFTVDSDLGHFWEIIDSLSFVSRCGGHFFADCLDHKALKRFKTCLISLLTWVGGEIDHNWLIAFLLKCDGLAMH